MFFPYGNTNAAGQQFFASPVYPNVSSYSSTGNHRHGNVALGYNSYYTPFYPIPSNILSSVTHINGPTPLIPSRPLSMLPSQHSSLGLSTIENDVERNQNLNIQECPSPTINRTNTPPYTIDSNYDHMDLKTDKRSLSTSSFVSHSGEKKKICNENI